MNRSGILSKPPNLASSDSKFAPSKRIYPSAKDRDAPKNAPSPEKDFPFGGILCRNTPLKRVDRKTLEPDSDISEQQLLEMNGFVRLATYNWGICADFLPTGTLIIPGLPRIFNDKVESAKLESDNWFISNPNGYQSPNYPMEAVFRSVEKCQEKPFDYSQYDILADSNSYLLISKFCFDVLELETKPVRMDVQRVGNLVVIIRSEECPIFKIPESSAYGLNYKNRVTIKPKGGKIVENYHHQVCGYQFGKLKLLMTSKVDCVEKNENADSIDDLVDEFSALFEMKKPQKFLDDSNLHFIDYGKMHNYEQIELLTRTIGKFINWKSIWTNIFFNGAKKLALGRVVTQTGELKCVEMNELPRRPPIRDYLDILRKTHSIFRQIVEFVRNRQEGKTYAIIFEFGRAMKIFDREGTEFPAILPEQYRRRLFPKK